MFKMSYHVLLAAGFMLTTWVPFLTVRLGSLAPKVLFITWFLLTCVPRITNFFKPRYAGNVISSFLLFAVVYATYIWFTDLPTNLYYGLPRGNLKGYIWVLCYWIILNYYISTQNSRALKQLALVFMAGVVMTALLTLRGYALYGDSTSRMLVGVSADSDRDAIEDARGAIYGGVGQFGHIYGMMLLIMPLIFSAKYVVLRWKPWVIATALLLLVCIVKASFTTAVFALMFGGLVLFSTKQRAFPSGLVWGAGLGMILICVIAAPNVMPPLLDSVERWDWLRNNEVYLSKIETFRNVFATKEYGEISRIERIQWSWTAFCEKPLLGVGFTATEKANVGGHSEIFDQLAYFGLIGILPLVNFLYWLNRYFDAHIYGLHPDYVRLKKTFYLPFIFVAIFNPIGHTSAWSMLLFLVPVMPLLYRPKWISIAGFVPESEPPYPWWVKEDDKRVTRNRG